GSNLSYTGEHVGCEDLREAIRQRPSLTAVVFGHVHHSYGATFEDNKWFINAAQYNGIYYHDVRNQPLEFFMERSNKMIYSVTPSRTAVNLTTQRPAVNNFHQRYTDTYVHPNQADTR
ncbi:unnamed protein product, partial [Rotaria socialis]